MDHVLLDKKNLRETYVHVVNVSTSCMLLGLVTLVNFTLSVGSK